MDTLEILAQTVSEWFVKKLRKPLPGNGGIPGDVSSFPSFYGMAHNSNELDKFPITEESLLKFGELIKQKIIEVGTPKNRSRFFGFETDYHVQYVLAAIAKEAGIHNCHFPMKMYLGIDFENMTAHFQINIQDIHEDVYPVK